MKRRNKFLTISLSCFVAAMMLLTFITSGCNSTSDIALSPEEIEALFIFTQADMDKVIEVMGNNLAECLRREQNYHCPACPDIPECPTCEENCFSNCRTEQYVCIYQCVSAGNMDCIDQCHSLFNQCQEECPEPACPVYKEVVCKPKHKHHKERNKNHHASTKEL